MNPLPKKKPLELSDFSKAYNGPMEDLLPHRAPFLFLEKLLYFTTESFIGEMTFHEDMWFFKGHFPQYPVVPGVILLESVAQCGGAGLVASGLIQNGVFLLISANNVKFRRQVRPNETIRIEIVNLKFNKRLVKLGGKAFVGDELAMDAEFVCVMGAVEAPAN
ncbi:MAG: 3-hydroxyacyl-ACP dehydratase FabZ family protein [bacterium]